MGELEVTKLGRDQLIKHIRKLEGALGRSEERALEQATRAHRLEQEAISLKRQIERQGRRLGQVMAAKHILLVKAGQTVQITEPPLPELQQGWEWAQLDTGGRIPIWMGEGDPPSGGPLASPPPSLPSQEPPQPPSGGGSGSTPSDEPTR